MKMKIVMNNFTKDEFIQRCANNRNLSVPEFMAWLEQNHLVVEPCDCEYVNDGDAGSCRGWKVCTPND